MQTEILEESLAYIEEHICEKISLAQLAEKAGYSPFYFSKLFSEVMGMPVTGYIRVRKLQYALRALLEGGKVLDVSLMYAFESHEGFTRSFTQLFGSTPSKVRKHLTCYEVPPVCAPKGGKRRTDMKLENESLKDSMHQIVYEVLRTAYEEVKEGYCTEIRVTVFDDGRVQIVDNGRGIQLSQNAKANQERLDNILSGHPITSIEYAQMGDFAQYGMQVANSLCESLQINVYRDGMCYTQDYVRGIAQHDVQCCETEHRSGTEIILKPDGLIFGETRFSADKIETWVTENQMSEIVVCGV